MIISFLFSNCYSLFKDDDDGGLIIEGPPSISVSITSTSMQSVQYDGNLHEENLHIDLYLQPLEVTYRERTLKNIEILLRAIQNEDPGEGSMIVKAEAVQTQNLKERKTSLHVCFTCPEINVSVPVDQRKITSRDFEVLFKRAGHTINHFSHQPFISFVIVNLSLEHKAPHMTSLSSENCTIYVGAPSNRIDEKSSTIIELLSFSSDPSVHADSAIKIYYSNDSSNSKYGEDEIKSSFPLVPPLSSVKARQEINTDKAVRAIDPQNIMFYDAERCISNINIEVPFLVIDFSMQEQRIISKILSSLITSANEANNSNSNQTKNQCVQCRIGVGLAFEQLSVSVHDSSSLKGSSFFFVADTFKSHAVLGDEGIKNFRVLSQNLTLYEGKEFRKR